MKGANKAAVAANKNIERINELINEISYLGWNVQSYLEQKYADEGYEYDEDVISDPHDRMIARTARACGLINTYSELLFGELRLDPDGVKHDAKYYEPVYKHIGYINDWDDILYYLQNGPSSLCVMYKKGYGAFHTVEDETLYKESDIPNATHKGNGYVECNNIGGDVMDAYYLKKDGWDTPRNTEFVDLYIKVDKK